MKKQEYIEINDTEGIIESVKYNYYIRSQLYGWTKAKTFEEFKEELKKWRK